MEAKLKILKQTTPKIFRNRREFQHRTQAREKESSRTVYQKGQRNIQNSTKLNY